MTVSCFPQVYLLLDEFIMGGELQETSKKVMHSLLSQCVLQLLCASVKL